MKTTTHATHTPGSIRGAQLLLEEIGVTTNHHLFEIAAIIDRDWPSELVKRLESSYSLARTMRGNPYWEGLLSQIEADAFALIAGVKGGAR